MDRTITVTGGHPLSMFALLQRRWLAWTDNQSRRVYIVPSRVGFAYVFLILLLLLGAINYNNSLGHLLSFLLVGLGHVAMHHSYRNMQKINIETGTAAAVFCGQSARLPLTFSQDQTRPLYQLQIAYLSTPPKAHWNPLKHATKYTVLQNIDRLAPGQVFHTRIALPTRQRGWMTPGRLRIASVFPLGLFFSWFFVTAKQPILVYPTPAGNRPFPQSTEGSAQQQSTSSSGQDDFAGFQNYRDGDAKHQIAWKAYARDDIIRTKRFSQPLAQSCVFQWEAVADITETEAKLSQLCQWVIQAEAAGMSYGLVLPGHNIPQDRGESHQHACLQALALYGKN